MCAAITGTPLMYYFVHLPFAKIAALVTDLYNLYNYVTILFTFIFLKFYFHLRLALQIFLIK